jgi:methylated-DNA-[protein]-cysteine S-methyltransferase
MYMLYDVFDSPLGLITLSTDGQNLTGLHIEGDRYFTEVPSAWIHSANHPLLLKANQQLLEYLNGDRQNFDLALALQGTDFQKQVWDSLLSIPAGTTTTYASIAHQIGRPKAVRAVGSAVGRNPISVIVPCHRVLASSGSLGGYVAGLDFKRRLLGLEGVLV